MARRTSSRSYHATRIRGLALEAGRLQRHLLALARQAERLAAGEAGPNAPGALLDFSDAARASRDAASLLTAQIVTANDEALLLCHKR